MQWLPGKNGWRRLMLPALILPLVSACGHDAFVIDTSCDWYRPVCLSRSDTEGTIDQVLKNEAAFESLCPKQAAAADCGGSNG